MRTSRCGKLPRPTSLSSHGGKINVASEEAIRSAGILIVDDEPDNVLLLKSVLEGAGYSNLASTTDPHQVLALVAGFDPDLILLDLRMPQLDGFAILDQIRKKMQPQAYLPILVLTADITAETKRRALAMGAKDFLTKPFDYDEVTLRVRNLVHARLLHSELQQQNEILEERVRARTTHLWEAVQRLTESEAATREATEETIRRLAAAAELRDEETGRHIERMSRYAALLAARAGMDPARSELIRLAASMHDVGKIGVPDRVLRKTGKLTASEYDVMKQHASVGHRLLADSKTEILQVAATIALTHHERFDGSGYPRGIAGDDIPLEGRIAAVADVFDALTTDRPYRKAYPLGQALEVMTEGRATHFDPELFDLFQDSLDAALAIMQQHGDLPARTTRKPPSS